MKRSFNDKSIIAHSAKERVLAGLVRQGSTKTKFEVVPDAGIASNCKEPFSAACELELKGKDAEQAYGKEWLKLEAVFTTLAEWNEYLENHVPYYSEAPEQGGPK